MDLLFKDVIKEKYYFRGFFLFLLLITSFSILENLTVIAQEDLEILINEGETDEDSTTTTTDEGNQQEEDKPIKLNTISPTSQNFWNDIIILVIGIIVAISLYFLIKHLIKRAADSLGLDKRQLKGINSITKLIIIVITIIIILFQFSSL